MLPEDKADVTCNSIIATKRGYIYSDGRLRRLVVSMAAKASLITDYLNAVKEFLETNDFEHLAPFVGRVVVDIFGPPHVLETRPNILYRLAAEG